MGFLTRAFETRGVTVVGDELWRSWKASNALSGLNVTPDTAMTFSAVFAAHKILSESTAMLPLFLLKRLKPRGKEPATAHPLYTVLHDAANPEMDSYLVRETMTSHLAGWGRAHAKIDYNDDGSVRHLWPIHPKFVAQKRNANLELVYEVTLPSGQKKTYPSWMMFNLRGLSPDGINVYTPIQLAKQGIGLALAAEGFGATLFGNGATPNGVLETDGSLSDKAYLRLKNDWSNNHQGISNANKFDILEEGLKWKATSLPSDDAQFLQTRVFQVEEIARWYRIPNMMLNMSGANSTYASVEAYGLQFVIYTLYPWLVRWEKAISMQLLLERERSKYFAEHLMAAILRGDTNNRYTAYGQGRQWGWLSVNDIRELENMNPIEGGDTYLQPSNMVDSKNPPAVTDIQRKFLPVLVEAVGRVLRREANDIRGAVQRVLAKRGAEDFTVWIGEFYTEHQEFIVRNLMPAALTYAELLADSRDMADVQARVTESLKLFALRRAGQVQEQFKNALSDADPARSIEGIIDGWDAVYIERIARMEISRQTAVLAMPKENV